MLSEVIRAAVVVASVIYHAAISDDMVSRKYLPKPLLPIDELTKLLQSSTNDL